MAAPERDQFEMAAGLADVTTWLIEQGLANAPVDSWLEAFCCKLVSAGLPLQRVNITTRAHHPEIGAVSFRWQREDGAQTETFERSGSIGDQYRLSPMYYMMTNPVSEVRQRLFVENPEYDFPIFEELKARGATDYIAMRRFFLRNDHDAVVDPMRGAEGMTISITTDAEGGFSEAHLDGIRSMIQPLCLTLKCGANRAMAEDITAAYLGRDASVRVLSGAIRRGSTETISAVIWYLDLADFTKMTEQLGGETMIGLLNDYFGEIVDLVEGAGGNVLKFMGDGMLAIFDRNTVPEARAAAVAAAAELGPMFDSINARRKEAGEPVTDFTLALHAGDVLYGNIGGKTRLDFTVIGPAVNTTARIQSMSDPLDARIIISAAVAEPLTAERSDLVSLGTYRLRGVSARQELFTLD